MQKDYLYFIARVSLFLFVYVAVIFTYVGFTNKNHEGDSINYHLPIAYSILNKTVLNPSLINGEPYLRYSPGASELILSIFLWLKIPENTFNVVAFIVLVFVAKRFGEVFGLSKNMAFIFAVSVCMLNTITRWLSAQIIDIWFLIFFLTTWLLLEKPQKNFSYFIKLGFSVGMFIGTKYTGPIFLTVLALFYLKNIFKIIKSLSFLKLVIVLFLIGIFGLSWYIRNFFLMQNPFYPKEVLFFRGVPNWNIFHIQVWKEILWFPLDMLSAFISEYKVWSLALPFSIVSYIKYRGKIKKRIWKIMAIGCINTIIYLFMPSSSEFHIFVSVFRYSYVAFIPFILVIFLLAQEFKKEVFLGEIALLNLIMLPVHNYHPKLLIVFIPIAFFVSKFLLGEKLKIQIFYKIKKKFNTRYGT